MSVICSNSALARTGRSDPAPAVLRARRSRVGESSLGVRPVARQAGEKRFRYLPDRPDSPLSALRVTGVGRGEIVPGEAYSPRRHPKLYSFNWTTGRTLPEHQVILFSNAAGEFESEATGRVRLFGEVLLFLTPGVWHRFRPLAGGGWTERWVTLHGDAVKRRFAEAGITPENPLFSPPDPATLREGFDLLLDFAGASRQACGPAATLAFRLMDKAVQQVTDRPLAPEEPTPQPETPVEDEIVRMALEIIWNHEHCPPLGVNDVARQLPVTRRTLDRRFAETLGRTVLGEINACRISRAKRLLADTDMPIKAVAYRAGFPSRERLRLAFLNEEGVPPSEYREAIRRDQEGA